MARFFRDRRALSAYITSENRCETAAKSASRVRTSAFIKPRQLEIVISTHVRMCRHETTPSAPPFGRHNRKPLLGDTAPPPRAAGGRCIFYICILNNLSCIRFINIFFYLCGFFSQQQHHLHPIN